MQTALGMKPIAPRYVSSVISAGVAMAVIFLGCGSDSSNEPPRPDAGRDSAADIARDAIPASPDLGRDEGSDLPSDRIIVSDPDVFVDSARDVPLDRGVEAGSDSPAFDGPSIDGPGIDQQIVDSGPCPAGQILLYTSPGCGADVKPVCGSPIQDACARSACSCSGKMIIGCDYFSEPWSKVTDRMTGCGADGGTTVDATVSEAGTVDSGRVD